MPTHACALILALLVAGAGPAAAADLDKEDKEWLDDVRPIMLPDEEKAYKDLTDKADREEFRKIFWARRDPDLSTPENEYQPDYEAAREKADRQYRVTGRPGSQTDCGRFFILLGEPDDTQVQAGSTSVLNRVPEVWVYYSKEGGRTFEGGEARIAFDEQCRAPSGVRSVIEALTAERIVQPQLDYRTGEDGRLVTLEDQLPKASPARALLDVPRQDFPLAAHASFMKISEEVTGVIGLIRGEAPDLPVEKRDGQEVVDIVVVSRVVGQDGEEISWSEQPVAAAVQPDGSFVASFGLGVAPGAYTLNAGAVLANGSGSLVSEAIEVPDFARVAVAPDGTESKVPSVASILFVREIEDLPEGAEKDPEHHYAAFRLGQTQLQPYFGRDLRQSDTVSFFYLIYDLQVDPDSGKADSVVAFGILKNGRTPVAQAPDNPITTGVLASAIGPVPLAAYPPGDYVVQLRVTDRLAKKTVVKNEKFRVLGPEGETP
jgi:GWxTD domain-containing protein